MDVGKTEILHPENFNILARTGNGNYATSKWTFNFLNCVSPFSNHKSQYKLFNPAITG